MQLVEQANSHHNLGTEFYFQGRWDEAIVQFQLALRLDLEHVDALNNLGAVWIKKGGFHEAIACYRRALQLRPAFSVARRNLAQAWSDFGKSLNEQGRLAEALDSFRQALQVDPHHADAHNSMGLIFQAQGQPAEAVESYQQALRADSHFAPAYLNLGNTLKVQGQLDEAIQNYRQALRINPKHVGAHNNLGIVLRDQRHLDEAIACYRLALEIKPDFAAAHCNLGTAFVELGDLQAAEACFRAALRHDSRFFLAYSQLTRLLGGKLSDQDLASQRRLVEEHGVTDADRMHLHFGLAHALDARADYPAAAEHLDRGNALQLAQWRRCGKAYDSKEHQAFITQMIRVCPPSFFERLRGLGSTSTRPIFVFGLPRSGTTLIEQILVSHSHIGSAGEMRLGNQSFKAIPGILGMVGSPFDCMLQLNGAALRRLAEQYDQGLSAATRFQLPKTVDKMPSNYLYLGLLAAMFPRGVFIHCRRDLRDVAVSCWMAQFQEVRWANEQQHIISRFQEYERIMAHWRQVLPVPMLEVDYEETVADLASVARKLVACCGLDWEPKCLQFYQTKRSVETSSAIQVRQPIFKTSVGRWEHYERPLASLFIQLRKLQELGSPNPFCKPQGPITARNDAMICNQALT